MSQSLLTGKRGVILGVANNKSIAWACAKEFAAQGAELAFNFLGEAQEKRVRELVKELPRPALVQSCDVTKDGDIDAFFSNIRDHWESCDFLVHSIAYTDKECLRNGTIETSRAQFASTLDISAYSLIAVCRAARELLQPGASVLSMSYYGAEKTIPKYNVMGIAKAALEASSRYLAYDLGEKGVRVNCISAGPVRTLSASAIPGFKTMLEATQKYAPLRRNITAEDVGRTALYLVSELSSGVTGEVVHVDSGYHSLGMFLGGEAEPG